jgi:tripartite-type tricarboxylate transporter receptor subunit TctC
MKLSRRRAFGVAAAVVAAPSVARLGRARGYPSRPLRVIVPVAAGGANDTTRACLRKNFRKAWGNSSTWKNLPGAGGNLGIASAARAPAEGYTLPAGGGNFVINPSLYAKIPYDPPQGFRGRELDVLLAPCARGAPIVAGSEAPC